MDVVHQHPTLGTTWIDVSVVSAAAGDAHRQIQAARKDGVAAANACIGKHARYGESVVPFVLEIGGRPSTPALTYVRTLLHCSPEENEEAPLQGATIWGMISCTLQRHVALQLRRAAGL